MIEGNKCKIKKKIKNFTINHFNTCLSNYEKYPIELIVN